MCTAVDYTGRSHYFGRNLDLEYSYEESVTITPRNFPFSFQEMTSIKEHYAMIGMAYVQEGYPLYYDATNEMGLSIAGLHFPGNAVYHSVKQGVENVAPFELIPWLLGQCADVPQAISLLLKNINLAEIHFSNSLPLTPLHWMLSDKNRCVVVEPLEEGLKLYDNPVGVLTNNPPFDMQLLLLQQYQNVTPFEPKTDGYSRGLGGWGLPGDLSSASRFAKAVFVRKYSIATPQEEVGQFFHILQSVEQQQGCVRLQNGGLEKTVYSSCCDTDKGIYYYTTYGNHQITGVDMKKENLDGGELICYPLICGQQIKWQNEASSSVKKQIL